MNKMGHYTFFTLMIGCLAFKSFALDIDEKLTIRFLKVSNSKKTVLINRGSEDGLVVGDHAKFFITNGIVARGMVEKVSPSRSIWSLYRVVSGEDIVDNKVLNIKIASPVKVTGDPTKSMKDEPIPEGMDKIAISHEISDSMEEVSDKTNKNTAKNKSSEKTTDKMNEDDQKELEDMGLQESTPKTKKAPSHTSKEAEKPVSSNTNTTNDDFSIYSNDAHGGASKNWEIYGTLSMNALSGTVTASTASDSTSASASVMDLSVGLEKYFLTSTGFLKDLSLFALLNFKSMEHGDSVKSTTNWSQYGGGFNYHFYNPTYAYNRFVGYTSLSFGMGSSSVKDKVVSGTTSTESSVDGQNIFLSLGIGLKYFFNNNFGMRSMLDYFYSKESFTYSDESTTNRTLSGPRIVVGLSYRFY
jgi:hypothetical protein